jgi:hypothetical protein
MSENVTNNENEKKTVSFKVSAHEYNVLKQYAAILHNQMIQDPRNWQATKNVRKTRDRPFNAKCDIWVSGSVSVHDAAVDQT